MFTGLYNFVLFFPPFLLHRAQFWNHQNIWNTSCIETWTAYVPKKDPTTGTGLHSRSGCNVWREKYPYSVKKNPKRLFATVFTDSILWHNKKVKVKWSRYRPGVAQRVGTVLLFHERNTRRGWVVSSTPRPYFTPGKDPVPIIQEAGWAPGPVWTGGKSRPHRDSIPDFPVRSQSLYRLSYRAHTFA